MFIVKKLGWNLLQLTPYHFLQTLLSHGIVFKHEKTKAEISDSDQNLDDSSSKYSPIASASKPQVLTWSLETIRAPYGGRAKLSQRTRKSVSPEEFTSACSPRNAKQNNGGSSELNKTDSVSEMFDVTEELISKAKE